MRSLSILLALLLIALGRIDCKEEDEDAGMFNNTVNVIIEQNDGEGMKGPLRLVEDCGRRPGWRGQRKRIRGGYRAGKGEFPSFISMEKGCSGTIIHPRIVLTAGHCIRPSDEVFVAATLIPPERWNQSKPAKKVRASQKCHSSKYIRPGDGHRHDMAVLILEKPIKFTKWVQPACLPSSPIGERERGIAVGSGSVNENNGVAKYVNALPVERCSRDYGKEYACFSHYDPRYIGNACAGRLTLKMDVRCPHACTNTN